MELNVIKLCLYLCAHTPTTDKCTTYVYHVMQYIYNIYIYDYCQVFLVGR